MDEPNTDLSALKVLIAEDQTLLRQALVALLETETGAITETANGNDALELLTAAEFDLALLDIGLPGRSGLEVLAEVKRAQPAIKVIILTGDSDKYKAHDVMTLGADGFMYKTVQAEEFLHCIVAVMSGDYQWPVGTDSQISERVDDQRELLTRREIQIVKLIVEGASTREVADALSISEHTVRKHREHINAKLGVHSPAALAMYAIKTGIA